MISRYPSFSEYPGYPYSTITTTGLGIGKITRHSIALTLEMIKSNFRYYYQFDGIDLVRTYKSALIVWIGAILKAIYIKQPTRGRGHTFKRLRTWRV